MPGGRINTKGRLDSWKPDPTRKMGPPEPDYEKDAERFAQRQKAKKDEELVKKIEEMVKRHGRIAVMEYIKKGKIKVSDKVMKMLKKLGIIR